jgi:hypothetical protein
MNRRSRAIRASVAHGKPSDEWQLFGTGKPKPANSAVATNIWSMFVRRFAQSSIILSACSIVSARFSGMQNSLSAEATELERVKE